MKLQPTVLLIYSLGTMCPASVLLAQSSTASVRGVVSDPSRAAIPGAKVTATDVQRNLAFSATTDAGGRYLITPLQPGTYSLSAEAAGFNKYLRSEFVLQVQQQATIDIELVVGATSTQVEVTASQPLLNMSSAEMGQVVENAYVRSIPLIDRYFVRLAFLAPGVVGTNADPGLANTSHPARFVSNGVRAGTADYFIDGALVSSLDQREGGTFLEMKPSVETIQEFKIQTNMFSAEFGKSGGTVVNVVSKSGTNEFHGSVYEYHRRDELNAQSFFSKRAGSSSLPDFTWNKYGGAVGGPVLLPGLYKGKNRTFFHFGLDLQKNNSAASALTTVPTALERRGDFSETRDAQGRLFAIYNPFDTYRTASGQVLRRPFPNNVIPASLQNPIARKVLEYYPQPTSEGRPFTHAQNYFKEGSAGSDNYQAIVRIDHTISDKQRVYGRYARERSRPGNAPFRPFGDTPADPTNPQFISHARTYALEYTRTPSPTTILSVHYSVARQPVLNLTFSDDFDPTSLGLPPVVLTSGVRRFPRFGPESYSAIGTPPGAGMQRITTTHSVGYSLTKIAGPHNLKTGGESRVYQINSTTFSAPAGNFVFNRRPTSENPLLANAIQGNGLASMLLGWGSGGNYGINERPASTSKYHGWYIQDDWKLTRKLTLNLGFRYDFELPRTERFDRYSWFDPEMPSPIDGEVPGYQLRGALRFTGDTMRSPFAKDMSNVQPRVGFAYALNARTTVRGGYGIYYSVSNVSITSDFGPPFSVSTGIQWSRDGGFTPHASLSNPFPDGVTLPSGKAAGAATFLGLGLNTESRDYKTPQYQQWSFSIQRALPLNSLLEVNYVGTKGTHLPFAGLENGNLLHPVYWSLGRAELNRQVPNPFFGVITDPVSALSAPTVPQSRLLRPYPQYTGLSLSQPYIANSIYHAGQVKFEKRFSHGLTALAHYTWSKLIDDSANSGYNLWGGTTPIQYLWDLRQERSVSPLDVAHRGVITFVYELPFGRGRAIGSGWSRALNLAAGGWNVSGILALQGGFPTVIGMTSGNLLEGSQRPNVIGDPAMPGSVRQRLDNYFNLAAFSRPAADTYGSAPRTLSYRTPGFSNADLTLGKRFFIREEDAIEVRLEAFNAFNGVAFGPPNASFGATTFGQINNYASGFSARQVQIAIRYDF
ncbi:MAG: carboxypeptidase regulatory-like domain-containing protein [Acidobacteria bacterium]|nr:carboxypeptidase regulatory-like domain-containing protein [Acidobacteriota bacterium]